MAAAPTLLGLVATVVVTAVLTVACPPSWQPWVQLVAALGVAVAVTARRRGAPLLSAGTAPRRAPVDIVDLLAPDRSPVGCVEGDRVVTTAVEISAGALVTTVVGRDDPAAHRGSRLPLTAVACQLDQGGVVLEGIDVVVRGRRSADDDDGEVYSDLVGPLTLVSHRRVHLLLRFDLERLTSTGAAERDATVDSVIAVATERLRRALVHHGMPCRVLDAVELAELYLEAENEPGDGLGFVVRPSADARAVVDHLTAVRAARSTEVLRLRRVEGRTDVVDVVTTVGLTGLPADDEAPGTVAPGAVGGSPGAVSGSSEAVDRVSAECHRLPTAAVVPVPGERLPGTVAGSLHRHRIDQLGDLAPPAHGAGQILGATRDGGAAALQIAGPHLRSVLLTARPQVCLQVTFRTVAAGYRVAVVTDVPDRWRPLLRIGDESRYRIIDPDSSDAGAPVDAVVWDVDGPLSEARIDALAGPGGPDVIPPTVIRVDADWELRAAHRTGPATLAASAASAVSTTPADLVLDGRIDGWIAVEPRVGDSLQVTVVAGPGEQDFMGPAAVTPAGAAPSASPGHP